MAKTRKCPRCKGRKQPQRCGRCNGFGRVSDDTVIPFSSTVTALFLLKDGTLFEIQLERKSARAELTIEITDHKVTASCILHHIDDDGIFHYEEV